MKYLKRVEGDDCEDCYFYDKTPGVDCAEWWGKRRCAVKGSHKDYIIRLATPDEIAEYKRKHPERCHKIDYRMGGHEGIWCLTACPFGEADGSVMVASHNCVTCEHFMYNVQSENDDKKYSTILCSHPSELPKEASDGK